jgi:hypothetical protein
MNRYFKLLRRVTPKKVEYMYIKTGGGTTNFLVDNRQIIHKGGVKETTYKRKKRVTPIIYFRFLGEFDVSSHFKKITSHQYEAALKMHQKEVIDCTEEN